MIDAQTLVSGFDARAWQRLVTLFVPGLASRAPEAWRLTPESRGGVLLVLHDGERVLRVLHTLRGAVAHEGPWEPEATLSTLADATATRFAAALRLGAVASFWERLGARSLVDDTPFATVTLVLGVLRELLDDGALQVLPRPPRNIPSPPLDMVLRAWDAVLADGHVAALVLFDGDRLDTAMAARRRGTNLDRLHGPEDIARMVGPLGGDFRRDYRVIRAALERQLGPLAVGVYAPTETFRRLVRGDGSVDWAGAVASRDVIIDPMPPWVAVGIGARALRGVAARSQTLLGSLEQVGGFAPFARGLRAAVERAASVDLSAYLGFDPMSVIASLLRQSTTRPPDAAPDDTR